MTWRWRCSFKKNSSMIGWTRTNHFLLNLSLAPVTSHWFSGSAPIQYESYYMTQKFGYYLIKIWKSGWNQELQGNLGWPDRVSKVYVILVLDSKIWGIFIFLSSFHFIRVVFNWIWASWVRITLIIGMMSHQMSNVSFRVGELIHLKWVDHHHQRIQKIFQSEQIRILWIYKNTNNVKMNYGNPATPATPSAFGAPPTPGLVHHHIDVIWKFCVIFESSNLRQTQFSCWN